VGGVDRIGKIFVFGIGLVGTSVGLISCGGGGGIAPSAGPVTKASVGKALFFDTSLSTPKGMACATCHSPKKAFTDPRPGPTSEGAVKGLFGFRKAPSIQYMAFSPIFQESGASNGGALGGQFWDGRAPDLPSQAKGPLLNPIEMGNASVQVVVNTVKNGPEAAGMKQIYGPTIFSDPNAAFDAIVDAIAAYEKTPEVSPFTSKYDAYLNGQVQLTASEANGLAIFNGKAQCFNCHVSTPLPDGTHPLFTNFTYANIGLPRNPTNPYYTMPAKYNPLGSSFTDYGLGNTTGRATDQGLFLVPSLRNRAVTGPYFHNGGFLTLSAVVQFYNTSELGQVFGPPEVAQNVNSTQVGNLQLTGQERTDLLNFINTLTDGFKVPK